MKGAIFDLDGTLIDSMWIWNELSLKYLKSLGVKNSPKNLNQTLATLTLKEGFSYLKETFQLEKTEDEIRDDLKKILEVYYKNHFDLKAGVLELLKELKNREVKMILGTATDEDLALMALKRHGIEDFFEVIQTEENTGLSKGNSKFFEVAIGKLDIEPSRIWVFEDALHCILSAKESGLNVLAIKDNYSKSHWKEIKENSDIYIKSFDHFDVDRLWR